MWYLDDERHRIDGPAVEYPDGTKAWYINDERHRVDEPALEHSDGTKKWYLNDQEFGEFEYYSLLKIRQFRSKIAILNNALKFNLDKTLKLSRGRATVEWYYSPDNGGGKITKSRIEHLVGYIQARV